MAREDTPPPPAEPGGQPDAEEARAPSPDAGAGAPPDRAAGDADSPPGPAGAPSAYRRDAARIAWVAGLASLLWCGFEIAATLITTPAHDVRVLAGVRVVALGLSLAAVSWLGLVAVLIPLGLAARALLSRRTRAFRGLFAPPDARFQAAAPWLWALFGAALGYVAASSYLTFRAVTYFKEPQLTALLLAVAQLVLIGVCGALAALGAPLLGALGRRLSGPLGRLNPFGRVSPALVGVLLASLPAIWLATLALPQLAPKVPWRHLIALAVWLAASYGAAAVAGRRAGPTAASDPARPRRRLRRLGLAVAGVAFVLVTLTHIGADHEAKSVTTTGSPVFSSLIDALRQGTDLDRDGFGFLLGENDCAPFDPDIHPLARDLPDNGIDENCNGRDFSFKAPVARRSGDDLPVPDAFRRDWNFLLLTIDTVRYDHTSFGGYIEESGRDTTPNLARLVERSTSFEFANAPSAGTMASIPAILTSKFFHSGIALDEDVKPRAPPRLRPENLLLAEILDQRGYQTGALLTHVYFEDWGMEQGFDEYDNELGATYNPKSVTSPALTDKAIAWIARHQGEKWFLWAHYLDPHGHYVEHPGEERYGDTEEDRYDGELRFTDEHLGRLFKELSNMPAADRTIIIITSDHGDAFGEHGFINHGQALYRELLHVPLIFYVPGLPPRQVSGAVSPLDIVPTVADLAGYEYDPAQFEGESLVPELFYGRDADDRVVFAETDWPQPLRAAISSRYKLVAQLRRNLYELYDLEADPWEKRNIATRERDAFEPMKARLDDWLERVYYARDARSNQQMSKLADILLRERPSPRHPVDGVRFDGGRVEVIGFDADKDAYVPGDNLEIALYLHVPDERPSVDYELQVEAWIPPDEPDGKPPRPARSKRRVTGAGVLPTSRWRPGEYIRDRFRVKLPRGWRGEARIAVGLGLKAQTGGWDNPTGPTRTGASHIAVLGELPLVSPPPDEAPDAAAP